MMGMMGGGLLVALGRILDVILLAVQGGSCVMRGTRVLRWRLALYCLSWHLVLYFCVLRLVET
jgi:hypothetical protein